MRLTDRVANLGLLFIILLNVSTASDQAGLTEHESRLTPVSEPIVARVYFNSDADLVRLAGELDIWEVDRAQGYVVAQLHPDQYLTLPTVGYRFEVDEDKTARLNRPLEFLPGQIKGIPGYPCYRTVEETFAAAEAIVAAHPDLATWVDVGDSWEKTQNPDNGYDMRVLRLTHSAMPGPKPKLFVMSAIHAREYAPAELATRFAEHLVNHYGIDPDVTWLLDYTEIHLMLHANPDGRKRAEGGVWWRKNTNNNYCPDTNSRGADLNRNFDFLWNCCEGSSSNPCYETYRGPSPASEPETQAIENYVIAQFPDQRPDDLTTPAPITSTGIFLDLHSYGQWVLWPWGFDSIAPNSVALQTLGRKFAYFNHYTPQQAFHLYPTDGTTNDFAYGRLGLAAYTFEVGTVFFQDCSVFQDVILPDNLPALIYAAKASRLPYQTPAGPDSLQVTTTITSVAAGIPIALTALADDTRYGGAGEPTQNIAAARYTVDAPSWMTGVVSYSMAAADGVFDSPVETVVATVNTTGWSLGRHILLVESQDAAGNWGAPGAVFVWVTASLEHVVYLPVVLR